LFSIISFADDEAKAVTILVWFLSQSVNDFISHGGHFLPGHLGVSFADFNWNILGCLSNYLEAPNNSINGFSIFLELFKT
jgi:hypothetical protein